MVFTACQPRAALVRPRRPPGASVLFIALLLGAAACSDGDSDDAVSGPAPSPSVAADAALPTTSASTSTTSPATTLPPATQPSCPPIPPARQPAANRPHYTLAVDVRPGERTVQGSVDVRFTPDLDTDRLVFRLWPNGPRQQGEGASIDVGSVELNGQPATSSPEPGDPTILVVPLPDPLAAGETVQARADFSLRLPGSVRDRIADEGDAVRLGHFFPILEWEPGVGWSTDPPTTQFAEASTAPTADFDFTVTVPEGFDVLASGERDPDPARPNHFTAFAVRDIAVAVGHFTLASAVAHAPDPVDVTVGIHEGLGEPPSLYLDKAVAVLEDFGQRFGPYPWSTFTVSVTPSLRSGIEYPTHVMHGTGTSGRSLSHEVGHQWFYGLVGNNQARDPWIDEGLASWAEARYENSLATFRNRSIPAGAAGQLGRDMTYWDPRSSIYYAGVYVQGTQALASLGDPELVDCALRVLVAQTGHGIATPADVMAAASAVFPDAAATFADYGVAP